jgi:hypothetical protein
MTASSALFRCLSLIRLVPQMRTFLSYFYARQTPIDVLGRLIEWWDVVAVRGAIAFDAEPTEKL